MHNVYLYILVMAGTTYLIRPYIKSFLFYVPYVCLAAMTFPAILFSTDSIISAIAGFITAVLLSYLEKSLLTVAMSACLAVFITERILSFF